MTSAPSTVSLARTGGTGLRVSWTGVTGATTYEVQISRNGGAFFSILSGGPSARSAGYSGVYGSSYRARVNAAGPAGVSPYRTSNTVTLAFPVPATPAAISLARPADLASISVAWSSVTYATTYTLERITSGTGWVNVAQTSATSRTVSGLIRGNTYQFRVRANNSSGSSAYRTSGSLTLVPFRPGSASASRSGDTSIRLTWPAANGATDYIVQVSVNGGGYSGVETTSTRDRTYSGLTRGSTYRYRIFSRNGGGTSPTARESDSVFIPFPPPPRPNNVYLTKTKRDIRVTYDASSPPAGTTILNYEIEIRADGGSYGSRRTDNGGGETYTNLNPGSTYQARVRAIGQGGASDWRESGTSTISSPPSTPSSIEAERIPTTRNVFVELGTSTAASDVTISGYEFQRRESTNNGLTWGAWGSSVTTDTTNRTTTYTNLNVLSTYEFRGRALSDFNPGGFIVSAPIFIPGIPNPPQKVDATRYGTSILVIIFPPTSDNGSPLTSYTLQRRVSDGRDLIWSDWLTYERSSAQGSNETSPLATVFLDDANIDLQKTYQYRALATNAEGDSESYTESDTVYIPKVVNIYERDSRSFRDPIDYKRYDATMGGWIGLNIAKKFVGGQWVELD